MSKKRVGTDEIRESLGIAGNPEREARIEAYSIDFEVAQLLYDLRTERGLTQAQLAEMVGTHASAISRLEDADYEGHSLAMLRRIARALGVKVVIGIQKEENLERVEQPDRDAVAA